MKKVSAIIKSEGKHGYLTFYKTPAHSAKTKSEVGKSKIMHDLSFEKTIEKSNKVALYSKSHNIREPVSLINNCATNIKIILKMLKIMRSKPISPQNSIYSYKLSKVMADGKNHFFYSNSSKKRNAYKNQNKVRKSKITI